MPTLTELEIAFDAACVALAAAQRAYDRSHSARNRDALAAAQAVHEAAAAAELRERDRQERAATVARRLALVAPRRELRARQCTMFGMLGL